MHAIYRLAGQTTKQLCLRLAGTLPVIITTSTRPVITSIPSVATQITATTSFTTTESRPYHEQQDVQPTRLVPVEENFILSSNQSTQEETKESDDISIEGRKMRHYTVNFGPQHPAAHGVLRLLLE